MVSPLHLHPQFARPTAPTLLVVMDGIGIGCGDAYDAVATARMPTLRALMADPKHFVALRAHGKAVGLPSDDDMGNSEVGHNALGAGRIVKQGASLVDAAIASGAIFAGAAFADLQRAFVGGKTLHIIGLWSDGGVHSRLDQIEAIVRGAVARGALRIRLHVLLDGRDVPDHSAQRYIEQTETLLRSLAGSGVDARIASGGGRMQVTMDRYESDWRIVERGYRAHVHGDGEGFASALDAVAALRARTPGISDQNLPPFVVVDANGPVGRITDGDAVLFANFRGDRALQITRAFVEDEFRAFDRGARPHVVFAGMMQYDGDLHLPQRYLVQPPLIDETSGEYLAKSGIRTLALSETQKYGHVTYFWNGNRSDKFSDVLEEYLEIPSYPPPFEARPQMRAPELATRVAEAVRAHRHDVIRVNLPNGDMVGHTGDLAATVLACEAVDAALKVMLDAIDEVGGMALIVADHGNADDMALRDKNGAPLRDDKGAVLPRTSHTLAPVPLCLTGRGVPADVELVSVAGAGLSNVAASLMTLLGFVPPASFDQALVRRR